MQAYKELAEIIRREQVAEDIYRFTVKAPDIAAVSSPGQFVMVRTVDGLDPLLRRPFSIHQVLEGGLVQILFKVIGKGTKHLPVWKWVGNWMCWDRLVMALLSSMIVSICLLGAA